MAVFWIVPAFYIAFGTISFALARVMPPPRPDVTTAEKVAFFAGHGTTIQIGIAALILIVGGAGVADAFCFLTAAYRSDRDPELLALLDDLGLRSYVGSLGCFSAAYFAFAIAILYWL